ncbi:MAG TPA: hypothetical protein VGJ22_03320 [Anaerolineales bacterium]|jgi:uncharacterized protein (DUF2126 family)
MNVQHINIKLFIENPQAVRLDHFAGIFNTWIQRRLTDDLLIDVADYLHVHHGPGIVLIGHEANYSLDNASGRLGLLYNRKEQLDGTTQDKLVQAVRSTLTAARRLEQEQRIKFVGGELQLVVNDRLLAPNTLETFAAIEADLKTLFDRLYKGRGYELNQGPDPRERFTVNVKAAAQFAVEALLQNLGVEPVHA